VRARLGITQADDHSLRFSVVWLGVVLGLFIGMGRPVKILVGCTGDRDAYIRDEYRFCSAFSVYTWGTSSSVLHYILRGIRLVRGPLPLNSPSENGYSRTPVPPSTT